MVYQLTPWDKILIMAIGTMVVAIVVAVVACFLGPGCFLYEKYNPDRLTKKKRSKTSEDIRLKELNIEGDKDNTILQYGTDVSNSLGRSSGRVSVASTSSSTKDSTYSSLSEGTAAAMLAEKANGHKPMWSMVSNGSTATIDSTTDEEEKSNQTPDFGQVLFSLIFNQPTGDKTNGTLSIEIKEVVNLPRRDYPGSCDPYVILQICPPKKPWRRSSTPPTTEFQTRTIRRTLNPKYDETFQTDLSASHLKDYLLVFTVYDKDRFSGPIPLRRVNIPLKEVKSLDTSKEKIELEYQLTKINRNCGDLMFGMTYLPTAERLSFSIIRANNLKYEEVTSNLQEFFPYVRVTLLNSTGRIIKKKKTIVQPGTTSPLYNETLIFDIPQTLLQSLTFVITVCVRGNNENEDTISENNNEDDQEEEDGKAAEPAAASAIRHPPKNKDKCIGKVAVGRHVRGKNEKAHWKEMVATQRKVITRTHKLK